ncbi:TIGR04282 family arsenosugar biosynthesis glycosyltransferase [Methylobacterium radiotolerans]|uniref:TIGR04282 family arsenosugar biosynthesis glycosyltransferase n=1 Tax=Methylobacterium radiotolerans TaxID=31998 RepID=UPI0038CFEAF8
MARGPTSGPAPTCAIGVMAKAPRSGRSKTRLCPPLTLDDAAALSAAFLRDTTANIQEAARAAPIAAYAAFAPPGAEALVIPHLARGTDLVLADGSVTTAAEVEGFGRCLLQAVQGMLAHGHAAACVLSSDIPTLPTRLLIQAARILLEPGERGVFGACDDGGYYILGLKQAHARLFAGIAWSTDTVAEATRARAREIGLDLVELEPWYDVDDAASLARLAADRTGYAAPATRSVLARLARASEAVPA